MKVFQFKKNAFQNVSGRFNFNKLYFRDDQMYILRKSK